jgi:hypothetical protein
LRRIFWPYVSTRGTHGRVARCFASAAGGKAMLIAKIERAEAIPR